MTSRKNGPNTGKDERGRFSEGNPGRPKGSRHKVTEAVLALLDGEAEALTRRAIAAALAGDNIALRLCLERVAPVRRDAPVVLDLPPVASAADTARAALATLSAVASGDITPTEGAQIIGLIDNCRQALEASDLESRIAALEALGK